ncbi:uncharacterized protein LOC130708585 [Balaenoptera acutorostrata]|uniref:Uncharacterized protein LOC130708585 n=1 Tax=Balaenoptera acutorostrata TaxID=9767 RepID=A0ABM3TUM0_BALAC|nr:uncharacterized protein LOC130708585 [Balaenoptera acutorostrata]
MKVTQLITLLPKNWNTPPIIVAANLPGDPRDCSSTVPETTKNGRDIAGKEETALLPTPLAAVSAGGREWRPGPRREPGGRELTFRRRESRHRTARRGDVAKAGQRRQRLTCAALLGTRAAEERRQPKGVRGPRAVGRLGLATAARPRKILCDSYQSCRVRPNQTTTAGKVTRGSRTSAEGKLPPLPLRKAGLPVSLLQLRSCRQPAGSARLLPHPEHRRASHQAGDPAPPNYTSHPTGVPAALSLLLHVPSLPLGLPVVPGWRSLGALRPRLSVARRRGSAGALGAAARLAGPAVARRSAAPPVCC